VKSSPLPFPVTPDVALRQLVARGVPGVALLESLGEVTFQSRFTLLSAAPVSVRHTLPTRPADHRLP